MKVVSFASSSFARLCCVAHHNFWRVDLPGASISRSEIRRDPLFRAVLEIYDRPFLQVDASNYFTRKSKPRPRAY